MTNDIDREYRRQLRGIRTQAEAEREYIDREALRAERLLRQQAGGIERDVQAAIGRVREAEALEQRKRDLPMTRPRDIGATEHIAKLETIGKEAISEVERARGELAKAKAFDLAAIKRAADEAKARLDKAKDMAVAEREQVEREYAQAQKEYKQAVALYERELHANYVSVGTRGRYVSKADFKKLDPQSKAYLKEHGVDAFNKWQEKNPVTITAEDIIVAGEPQTAKTTKAFTITAEDIVIAPPELTGKVFGIKASPKVESAIIKMGEFFHFPLPEGVEAGSFAQMKHDAIQGAKVFVIGAWTADWNKMTPTQRVINAAIDVTIIGGLLLRPSLRLLKPSVRQTAKVAGQSGKAYQEMKAALNTLRRTPMSSPNYAKVAAKAQTVIQKSLTADKKFVERLTGLNKVTKSELAKLERTTGLKGLKRAVLDVSTAQKGLDKAWKSVRHFEIGSPKYIAKLPKIEAAQGKLATALENFNAKVKPRYAFPDVPEFKGFRPKWTQQLKPIVTSDPVIGTLEGWRGNKGVALAVLEKPKVKVEFAKQYTLDLKPAWEVPTPVPKEAVRPPKVKPARSVFPGVVPRIATARDVSVTPDVGTYIEAVGKPMAGTQLIIKGDTALTPKEEFATKVKVAEITKQAIKEANKTATRTMTEVEVRTAVETRVKTQVKAITQTKLRTRVKQMTKLIVDLAMRTRVRVRARPKLRIPIRLPLIPLPDGTSRPMTEKELAGAVAWKQGFIYKLIYPPYGKGNILHSTTPFEGVRTAMGARSAYETITRLGGKLPSTITRDMGIMDVHITSPRVGRPTIRFRADPKQRTRITKIRKRRVKRMERYGLTTAALSLTRG